MLKSMTAFARLEAKSKAENWAVEIRSLNHRYFDFSLKVPAYLYPVEDQIRLLVQEKMRRGKVTVTISHDHGDEDKGEVLQLDEEAVRFYLTALKKLKKKFRLEGDVTLRDLIGLPKIFTLEKTSKNPEKYWVRLKPVLLKALERANSAKEKEGQKLAADILERVGEIGRSVSRIEQRVAENPDRYFRQLTERVSRLVGDQALDRDRLHLEVAFLSERSDITEELVRLKSHLDLFKTRVKEGTELGRELDFLCQEINREINTLGSKSQLFEISTEVIFVKRELEKIREQIQNIE